MKRLWAFYRLVGECIFIILFLLLTFLPMNGIGSGSGAVQVVQKVDSMEVRPSYVANPAGTAPRSHNGELSMGLESSLIIQVNGAGVCQVDPHIVTLCVPSSQFVQRIS